MKHRIRRLVLIGAALIPAAALVGPFLVPVPPLEDTRPLEELADPDSQFIEVNGLKLHVKTMGQGEPVFLLLHGFGASLYSWHAVMEPLSRLGRVIAFDRPAFGLTERPLHWQGPNPYSPEKQVALVLGLLDHFKVQRAILVGNSAGGTISMRVALEHPERVSALVLVDPAVYQSGGTPEWIRPLLATPQMRHLGPLLVRQIKSRGPGLLNLAWHDTSRIQPEVIELYKKVLQAENWDKALWEFTLATRPVQLAGHLNALRLPVLVVTGDDDRIVPTTESIRLSQELPDARLVVIANAGHLPHEERPAEFMEAVNNFLGSLH